MQGPKKSIIDEKSEKTAEDLEKVCFDFENREQNEDSVGEAVAAASERESDCEKQHHGGESSSKGFILLTINIFLSIQQRKVMLVFARK